MTIRLNPRHSGPPYVGTCAVAPEVVRADLGVERVTAHSFNPRTRFCRRCGAYVMDVLVRDRGHVCPDPVEQPVDHGADRDWPGVVHGWLRAICRDAEG